jgi:uncharacterized membrane protein YgcG
MAMYTTFDAHLHHHHTILLLFCTNKQLCAWGWGASANLAIMPRYEWTYRLGDVQRGVLMAKMLTLHPVSRWAGNQSASGGWPGVRARGVRSGGWQAGGGGAGWNCGYARLH